MSPAKPQIPLEDVLFAFSVEPTHDKLTLERYLTLYPQFTEDLVDLSHELRIEGRGIAEAVEDEATFQRALKQFTGVRRPAAVINPFDAFRGAGFAALAKKLRVPRSVLLAFRDRLVIASSVPAAFVERVARAANTTVADLMTHLDLPPVVATPANYKANEKPTLADKVAFDTLLDASGTTTEQKLDIYTAAE
ncbi:MAG TPA: hypothetical protein VN634_19705 [Candidatus Limnocylindrales bacterium]|nr:hypothetical protein [Candidatus Limnocylindrales bacterium]